MCVGVRVGVWVSAGKKRRCLAQLCWNITDVLLLIWIRFKVRRAQNGKDELATERKRVLRNRCNQAEFFICRDDELVSGKRR